MFTPEQRRAAEIIVARLVAEAAGEEFDFAAINVTWLAPEDPVSATSDGLFLTMGDFVGATLHLLWLQVQLSSQGPEEISRAIERLALEVTNAAI